MKNKKKSINKFKLSLNSRKIWEGINFNILNQNDIHIILHCYHLIYRLKALSSRGINLLMKNFLLKFRYKKQAKKKKFGKFQKKFFFFNFFKKQLYIKQLLKSYQQITKIKYNKKFLPNIMPIFSGFSLSHILLKQNLTFLHLKLYFNVSLFSEEIGQQIFSSFQKKRFIQKQNRLLLLYLKVKLEKDLQFLLKKIIIINFINLTEMNTLKLKIFNKLDLRSKRFAYSNISKIQNIRNLFLTGFITGFNFNNAKLIAEQIAIGLNRIKKQKAFFYAVLKILKHYTCYSSDLAGLKFILCGKLGAKTRTQFKIFTFRKPINNQNFALKVDYGFTTAETFTGSFGIHIWLYRKDPLQHQKSFKEKLRTGSVQQEYKKQNIKLKKRKYKKIFFGWGLRVKKRVRNITR